MAKLVKSYFKQWNIPLALFGCTFLYGRIISKVTRRYTIQVARFLAGSTLTNNNLQ